MCVCVWICRYWYIMFTTLCWCYLGTLQPFFFYIFSINLQIREQMVNFLHDKEEGCQINKYLNSKRLLHECKS